MSKYRYRIPPCTEYDIPATENWLEEMAEKGLHLAPDGFFSPLVIFEEGSPRQERFRLEATATKKGLFSQEYDPTDDAVQMLRQMGWHYRGRRGQFHIYSATDPSAPELNTDPQVQAISMAVLEKYLRKLFGSTILLLLLHLCLTFGHFLVSTAVWLGSGWMALALAVILWWLCSRIHGIVSVSRYRRMLQRGEDITQQRERRRYNHLHIVLKVTKTILIIFLFLTLLCNSIPLLAVIPYEPLVDQSFPFPTLQNFYPEGQIDQQSGILRSEVYSWTDFLSPENYDLKEYSQVTMNGETFDCYLTVTYHRTRWEWTSAMLAREMVGQAGDNIFDRTAAKLFGKEPITAVELNIPGTDYCGYYYSGLPDPYLVIRQGKVVIKIRYAPLGQAPEWTEESVAQFVISQIQQ